MGLSPGVRLGPYEIVAPIGAGGMGEVYRARDTRLDRDVAIKVLPSSLAADPESRARFEREARAVSQLNHPHICALYDVGHSNGVDFLVMEYIEGESLATRLARGPLRTNEALDYAVQIADALDKAHRHGIVHRDLKPANVMLTKGGAARSLSSTSCTAPSIAKLLDFGLAKLAPPPTIGSRETVLATNAGASAPRTTAGSPATAQGTILGTFQYMAPEQIEGTEVDARADIWAFGCVLYEMITGRRAFEGKTQASVIAAILGRDPTPVAELQPLAPPALGRLIRLCLAKDPDARFQSSYDLLLQLQWIAEGGSAAGLPQPIVERRKRRERTWWIAAAVAAVALGAALAWFLKPAPIVANASEHFAFPLPEGQAFTRIGRRYLAISPDGKKLAYIANEQIYLREMNELAPRPIQGTNEDPLDLTFSPNGDWIAYFVPGQNTGLGTTSGFTLKKIQIAGGAPVPLCSTGWPFGTSWEGHTIVFGQNSDQVHGIQAVPDTAGAPKTLVTVSQDEQATQPHLIAGGKLVLFAVRHSPLVPSSWDDSEIVVQAPGEATRTVLVKGGTDARLVADRLIYYRGGNVLGIGIDPSDRSTHGGPVPIVEGVSSATNASGAGIFAVADNGTLAFQAGAGDSPDEPRQLVWVDRQGQHEEKIPAPARPYRQPRLSPDQTRIVVTVETSTSASLYMWDFAGAMLTRLSPSPDTRDDNPVWTPDGHVIYRSAKPDGTIAIMRIDANGVGAPEPLVELGRGDPELGIPDTVSPNGQALTFRLDVPADVMVLPLVGDRKLRPLLNTPATERNGAISPDGQWLAYVLSESRGPGQIIVRPYPKVETGRWPVASIPGGDVVWARSSRELYFVGAAGKMFGLTVQPGPVFGRVVELFDERPYLPPGLPGIDYDTAPDGRFLMIKRQTTGTDTKPTITVFTHWTDELRARVK